MDLSQYVKNGSIDEETIANDPYKISEALQINFIKGVIEP